MAVERKWLEVGPYALTAPGGTNGQLTLTSTVGLKVKQQIRLSDPVLPTVSLEVKRVLDAFNLLVGPPGNILFRADVSAYSATSSVTAPEQPRNDIPLQEIERAIYEEEPTVAWRTALVDLYGNLISEDNPLFVSVDGMTVTTRRLTDDDNDPSPGDIHDAVRVGDGSGNYVAVNSDGSINVIVENGGGIPQNTISSYSEITSVPNGVLTTINSYVVPVGKTAVLSRVDVNGTNISDYQLYLNGSLIDRRRTYFGSSLNDHFVFFDQTKDGLPLIAGDTVTIQTIHGRPDLGDFGARIQVLLIG